MIISSPYLICTYSISAGREINYVTDYYVICSNVFFHNLLSTFTRNAAADGGVILAYKFPMQFEGTNLFTENTGGGVALLQTRMDIAGNLRFQNNTALTGGGIKMQEQSVVGLIIWLVPKLTCIGLL